MTDQTTAAAPEVAAANQMLDEAIRVLRLKNDAALSRALEVGPPVISKIRRGHLAIGDSMLIRFHETTGWAIRSMKAALKQKSLPCLAA